MQNSIREIKNNRGEVAKNKEEIKEEASRFFKEFLSHKPEDYQGKSVRYLQQLIEFRCLDIDKNGLIQEVSAEVIKNVLFSMPNNKSPVPDGYTNDFFQKTWSTIGKDFTIVIQSFFVKVFLAKGLKATILALIPKSEAASKIKIF